jgi:hypothetical protein
MAYLSFFSCVRNTIFLQQCSIERNAPSTVSLLRRKLVLEARGSSMLFCGENGVNFKRNTAYISGFSVARNIIFLQNSPLLVNGRSTVSLVIRLSMLLAGWPSIMCPWECWVIFLKGILPTSQEFPIWTNTCILWTVQTVLNGEVSFTLFP